MKTRLLARIDCRRLAENWRVLNRLSSNAETAAVIKADAYGHGMEAAAETLFKAGCRFFFTASFDEAIEARRVLPPTLPQIRIGVFDSLTEADRDAVLHHKILPSVNSLNCLKILGSWAGAIGKPIPAMLAIDTGMNRLGVKADRLPELIESPFFTAPAWQLVFSHLASADEPTASQNTAQQQQFDALCRMLPPIPKSLAASAGIMLGRGFHYNLTRPGIALYGSAPVPKLAGLIKPVLSLHARILQISEAQKGETIGYNATTVLTRPSRLATIAGGYADGISRALTHKGIVHLKGFTAPMLGRVSMDTIVIDITDWPTDHVQLGDMVSLIDDSYTADTLARRCGTIAYEVLTGLGGRGSPPRRITRQYV